MHFITFITITKLYKYDFFSSSQEKTQDKQESHVYASIDSCKENFCEGTYMTILLSQ